MDISAFSSPAQTFEQLIVELLAATGSQVLKDIEVPGELGHDRVVDYVIRRPDCTYDILEIKHYRLKSRPRIDMLERAFVSVNSTVDVTSATVGILVLSCPNEIISDQLKRRFPRIRVWGLRDIFTQARAILDLFQRLATCLELDIAQANSFVDGEYVLPDVEEREVEEGARIAEVFTDINPGREDAYRFEDACIKALRFLFEFDLAGWHPQSSTTDELHRRDLVCRILAKSEIWSLLLNDIKSRYVVFEFKNYREPFGQAEVITTERYLYPMALRNVAIIISQNGHNESARKVMDGAMREHGKLIISIKVAELRSLLIGKDKGEDPNGFLFQRVDEFLIGLAR
ncbi:hypothetical protein [Pseudomonas petroselini]|uniref:hypothetical protein n=1 Tax=Pseudomonas petroselini TaxID=2899822 RepID=UPI00386D8BDE